MIGTSESERILDIPNCLSKGKKVMNTRRTRKSGELEERAGVLQPIRYPTKFLSPNANRPRRNFEAIKKPASSISCKKSVEKLRLTIKTSEHHDLITRLPAKELCFIFSFAFSFLQ